MGFSLHFMVIDRDQIIDADRAGLIAFLDASRLRIDRRWSQLSNVDTDEPLSFDGSPSDFSLDPLDQADPVTGYLSHATCSPAECAFIFDLCRAGRMMIVNAQGSPMYIGITGIHNLEAFPDPEDTAFVGSGDELFEVLSLGYAGFQEYRARVLRSYEDRT
ncbi:hypothetical protein [Microbacterium gorillae]|uniref:hypothetical protein n=1 Tax=Microbacterium gorillae TaxID=1231063 RepID=UPI003D984F05